MFTLLRLFSRWDAFVLLCFFIDALGDVMVESTFNLFASENYRATDTLAALTTGSFLSTSASIVILFGGSLIDRFPKHGPLGMISLTKTGQAAILLIILLIDLVTSKATVGLRPIPFAITIVLLMATYMPLEALGSLAYTLTIKRGSEGRDERVRASLYNFQYSVYNLAAFGANMLITLARKGFGAPEGAPDANRFVLSFGAVSGGITAIFSTYLFTKLRADKRFHAKQRHDEETPQFSWRRIRTQSMGLFLLMKVGLIGSSVASLAQSTILPKYLIRHFGESALYALFLAINPAMMIILAAAIPFTPLARLNTLFLLVVGTTIQALAPLWIWVFDGWEWPIAVYMVQFTIGEALAMPRLNEFFMSLIPNGSEGFYVSVGQIPGLLIGLGLHALGGLLLQSYCPSADECSASLWLIVICASIFTPVIVTIVRIIHDRHQAKVEMN